MTANQIAYWNLQETKRGNRAKEAETYRSNTAHEAIERDKLGETRRANLVNEGFKQVGLQIDQYNATTQRSKAAEESRHNFAVERETQRSNKAKEDETVRSNMEREYENRRSNLAKEAETNRSNVARETETNRSNLVNEAHNVNRLIYDIDKAQMEESGRNARNALDNLVKVIGTGGQLIGTIIKPGSGYVVTPTVGSGLTITNAN